MDENGFITSTLHSDRRLGTQHGAIHQPLHPSTEFGFQDARELAAVFQGKSGFTYSRQGTPTTAALEAKITRMEKGIGSVSFATGMAALAATLLTLLRQGDHLIASKYLFGNTNSLLGTLRDLGVQTTLVDATDVAQVQAARQANTRMVFVETIANPGTQVADLQGVGQWCQEQGLLYVVDATLSSPYLSPAREFKASLVVNSLSKHIGGHGNALGGMVTDTGLFDWSTYPNIAPVYRNGSPQTWGLVQIRKKGLRDMGGTLSSDVAHRLAVGSETLPLRMERICSNALALARHLRAHPQVQKVQYPGLEDHPQHERTAQLFGQRFGGLMSVVLDGDIEIFDFLNRLKVFVLATHLGDNRSLVLPVAHTIYHEMGAEQRALMGISDNQLRISVGIEEIADLTMDFDQALAQS